MSTESENINATVQINNEPEELQDNQNNQNQQNQLNQQNNQNQTENSENTPKKMLTTEERFKFYNEVLKKPEIILAPMVDGSDVSYRSFLLKHGINLCYTPMVMSKMFVESKTYRREIVKSLVPEERPIIIQIVGNDPTQMARTAKFLQSHGDAIDINLGCPQNIAQKGKYGAYLAQDFELTKAVVTAVVQNTKIPVYCKIRVFEDLEKTIQFVKMLEECGIDGLCVHGRTIREKTSMNFAARWSYIAEVKKVAKVPVIANGEMRSIDDYKRCKEQTNADGFMIGIGLLLNPGMMEGVLNDNLKYAEEYLQIAKEMKEKYTVKLGEVKGHLIKMMLYKIKPHNELMKEIGDAHTFEAVEIWFNKVKELCERKRNVEDVDLENTDDMNGKKELK